MSGQFFRIVNDAEWEAIKKSKSIRPSNSDDWGDYGPGQVVFLHRDTVSISYLMSYVEDYCAKDPGCYHLVRVTVPPAVGLKIQADDTADYDQAVAHPGAMRESDGCEIHRVATFDCRDSAKR